MRRKVKNSLLWLLEPLEGEQDYIQKPMFGCLAAYLHGRLMAVIADREPPFNGLLVPTSREFHESIIDEFPALISHPILGKWLYIPIDHDDFEQTATELVELMLSNDPRLGVEPKEKGKKKRKKIKK